MPLRSINTLAVTFVLLAAGSRAEARRFRILLAAACLLDAFLLANLMTARGALATATRIEPGIRMVHIVVSAFFPLLYPLLLVAPPATAAPDDRLPVRLFAAFLGLRLVSFLTSYFMVV